jgi:hypothetical protein
VGSGGRQRRRLLSVLATALGVIAVVAAVVIAFNLGRGEDGLPPLTPDDPVVAGPSPDATTGKPVAIASVADFDPQGDPPEENSDLAPLASDGDPATAWRSVTYFNNPRLGLLKDGVGLVLDLGRSRPVSRVDLTLGAAPTTLQLLAAGTQAPAPTDLTDLRRVAGAANAGPRVRLAPSREVRTRYLVVWLTSLPPVGDGYVGEVAEVVVRS